MNTSVSSRFLYEATNQLWSSFLREATGILSVSGIDFIVQKPTSLD